MTTSSKTKGTKISRYLIGAVVGCGLTVVVFLVYDGMSKPSSTREGASVEMPVPEFDVSSSTNLETSYDIPQLSKFDSDFARSAELHEMVSDADGNELLELLQLAQDITHASRRYDTQAIIAQKLATQDPLKALELLEDVPNSSQEAFLTGIFREWSTGDLEGAIEGAKTLEQSSRHAALKTILRTRNDLPESELREIARELGREEYSIGLITEQKLNSLSGQPEAMWNTLVNDSLDDVYQIRYLRQIAKDWVEQDGFQVLVSIASTLEEAESYQVRTQLVRSGAETNPREAFEYLHSQPDEASQNMSSAALGVWAQMEPKAALAAALEVKDDQDSKRLVNTVVGAWARKDPRGLLQEIDQFEDDLKLEIAERAIANIAQESPTEAAQIVDDLASKVSNTSMIAFTLVYHWEKVDPKATLDWILSDSQKNNTNRRSLIESAIRALAHVDPEHAFQVGLEQPLVFDGDNGMESDVILELCRIDIETAISYFHRVREESKSISALWITQTLVEQRDPHRALEIVEQLPEPRRRYTYQSIGNDWASNEPLHMYEELRKIEDKQIRSVLALSLISGDSRNAVLTSDQMEVVKSFLTDEDAKQLEES